jgi:hypothetical protein
MIADQQNINPRTEKLEHDLNEVSRRLEQHIALEIVLRSKNCKIQDRNGKENGNRNTGEIKYSLNTGSSEQYNGNNNGNSGSNTIKRRFEPTIINRKLENFESFDDAIEEHRDSYLLEDPEIEERYRVLRQKVEKQHENNQFEGTLNGVLGMSGIGLAMLIVLIL